MGNPPLKKARGRVIPTAKSIQYWRFIAATSKSAVCCHFLVQTLRPAMRRYAEAMSDFWRGARRWQQRLWRASLANRWGGKLAQGGRQYQVQIGALWDELRARASLRPLIAPRLLEAALAITLAMLPFLCVLLPPGSGWGLFSPWGIIFLILFLMGLTTKGISDPGRGSGLLPFWLALAGSALFGAGCRAGYLHLVAMTVLLLMSRLTSVFLNRGQATRILKFLTFSSLIWILIGLRQLAGAPTPPGWLGGLQSRIIPVRIYAVFGNPNVFAIYLLPVICWAYYLGRATAPLGRRLAYGMVLGAACTALYFTYSRTAWLILFAGIIYGCFQGNCRFGFKKVMINGGWALLLCLVLTDFRTRMFSLFLEKDRSVWVRPVIWKAVWQAIQTGSLWGAGPGAFAAIYPWYGRAAPWAAHAHQQYLQIWLETGLLGLIAFGLIVKRTVLPLLRGDDAAKAVAFGLIGFLMAGFTETWTASPFLDGFFWLMIGLGGVLREKA